MTQNTPFLPSPVPQDQLSVVKTTPSTNGTHDAPQTVVEAIQTRTTYFNPTYWREKLLFCHVPANAPAAEWVVGIERVATIYYKPAS